MVQLRHMGGALARSRPAPAPARRCRARSACSRSGWPRTRGRSRRCNARIDPLVAAAQPHRAGHYPNFVEEPADASAFFDAATWARLRAVKAAYDPQDLFKGNHYIPPAERIRQAAGLAAERANPRSRTSCGRAG